MTASQQLRAVLEDVASGKVSPEVATEAVARWMVLLIKATNEDGAAQLAAAKKLAVECRQQIAFQTVPPDGAIGNALTAFEKVAR